MASPVSLHVLRRRLQFSQMASSKFKKPNAQAQPRGVPRRLQRLVSLRLRLRHGLQMLAKPLSEDFAA